ETLRRHAFSVSPFFWRLVLDYGPIDSRAFWAESALSRASIVVAAPWIRARRHPPPPRPSRLARDCSEISTSLNWTTVQLNHFAALTASFLPMGARALFHLAYTKYDFTQRSKAHTLGDAD